MWQEILLWVFHSTFWAFLCISQAPLGRSLWSGHHGKDLFLLQKLSIDDANFGQNWWHQKCKKGQGSSWPRLRAALLQRSTVPTCTPPPPPPNPSWWWPRAGGSFTMCFTEFVKLTNSVHLITNCQHCQIPTELSPTLPYKSPNLLDKTNKSP